MKAFLVCPPQIKEEIIDTIEGVDFSFAADGTLLNKAIELAEVEGCDFFIVHDQAVSENALFEGLKFYSPENREMTVIFIADPHRERPSEFYDKLILQHKVTQIIAPKVEDDFDWIVDLSRAFHRPIPQKNILPLSKHVVEQMRKKVLEQKKKPVVEAENDAEPEVKTKVEAEVETKTALEDDTVEVVEDKTEIENLTVDETANDKENAGEEGKASQDKAIEEKPIEEPVEEVFEEASEELPLKEISDAPVSDNDSGLDSEPESVEKWPIREEKEVEIVLPPVPKKKPVAKQGQANTFLSFGGTRYVAVTQVRPREGSTHLTFALGRALSLANQKVALVVPTSTYLELRRTYCRNGVVAVDEDAQMIDLLGIHFYRNTDGYNSLQAQNYDYVIADLGLAEFCFTTKSPNITERDIRILTKTWDRAEVRIISSFITPVGHWYAGSDFLNSRALDKKEVASIQWAVFGMANDYLKDAVNRHLAKHMPKTSTANAIAIPYMPVPLFMKQDDVPQAIYSLIEPIVDKRTKEFSGAFKRVVVEEEPIEKPIEEVKDKGSGKKSLLGKFFGGKR